MPSQCSGCSAIQQIMCTILRFWWVNRHVPSLREFGLPDGLKAALVKKAEDGCLIFGLRPVRSHRPLLSADPTGLLYVTPIR
jgi:hypothetical protein